MLTLFHATNKSSCSQMLKKDMGLDLKDYLNLINKIGKQYGISEHAQEQAFSKWSEGNIQRPEINGGVSFFQSYSATESIAILYASFGGEFREKLIETLFKCHARDLNISFNSKKIQEQHQDCLKKFLGTSSEAVIIEVEIPENLIANKEDIGTKMELYTKEKIPAKHITGVYVV